MLHTLVQHSGGACASSVMGYMFRNCHALTSLDLSSFDTSNVVNMSQMFKGDANLKTIYATSGKWNTSGVDVSDMFTSCGTKSVTYK